MQTPAHAARSARVAAISAQMVKIAPKLTDGEFAELVQRMTDARADGTRGRPIRPRRRLRRALPGRPPPRRA